MWHEACYTKCKDVHFSVVGRDDLDDLLIEMDELESDDPN